MLLWSNWKKPGGERSRWIFNPCSPHRVTPAEILVLQELIKVDQERLWRAGKRKLLENYLTEWPELSQKAEVVVGLLDAECRLRADYDLLPTPEELRSRFPDVADLVDLHAIWEESNRNTPSEGADTGMPVSVDRLPEPFDLKLPLQPNAVRIHCPHCHNPIELVEQKPIAAMTCPSCGSKFSVASGEPLDRQTSGSIAAGMQRTIAHFELVEQLGIGRVWHCMESKRHQARSFCGDKDSPP